jgi:eukaryotic-like serine/threonine-protein kinase
VAAAGIEKMTPERYRQVGQIYLAALELKPDERAAYLAEACAGDEALRREVESLLEYQARSGGLLDQPILQNAAQAMADAPTTNVIGQNFGHYRILSLLGKGGMGEVYLGEDIRLGRKVAIKLLPARFMTDAGRVRRFTQEARAASALNHPNIITIYDIGQVEGVHFIATEFILGETLRQRLAREHMSLQDAIDVAAQIAAALNAAHEAGITHRDIKPENVMVRRDSLVKVLDFGLAKLAERRIEAVDSQAVTLARCTDPGTLMGTPQYMSPEQARGQEVDARSDLFSLGIVLYEIIVGSAPFTGATIADILVSILDKEPLPITRYSSDLPAELERIVSRCLAKQSEQRYQSAKELLADLKSLAADLAQPKAATKPFPSIDILPFVNMSEATHRRRLAILPLRNLAGDPEIEFLGFALADAVITQLAPIKSLIVRPSSAVEKYRNQMIDPRSVGREMLVDTILSGSYLKAGETFRVNVQLIDVARNEILWQERIDLKFDNVISLQDHICEELIHGLRLTISTGEQEAIKLNEARNPLAYEFYLRGLAFGSSAEEDKQALEILEASVGLDPSYAPAWAALAGRYISARNYLRDETLFAKAETAARRALEINPQLPSAFFWLAVYYGEKGDVKNALAICRQLLQAAPNSEYAYQAMGHVYDYAGLPDIALTLFRKAAELNPVTYPPPYMIGFIHYQKGDLVGARQEFEACPDIYQEKQYWLSVIDFIEGHKDEAIARLEQLPKNGSRGAFHAAMCAFLCALKGEFERGKEILDQAISSEMQLGSYHFYIQAEVYAQLGYIEKSHEMLRAAINTGYGNYPFLLSDPLLAPARTNESFTEIVNAIQRLQTQLQSMLVTG